MYIYIYIYIHTYTYIYIYIGVCVCVCVYLALLVQIAYPAIARLTRVARNAQTDFHTLVGIRYVLDAAEDELRVLYSEPMEGPVARMPYVIRTLILELILERPVLLDVLGGGDSRPLRRC